MELSLYDMSTAHRCSYEQMSLAEMLELQDHPVSEEQAWALCYQLCRMLSQQSAEQTLKPAAGPAAEAVLLSRDGGVSLRQSNSGDTGNSCVIETEEQAVEFVGRLVYLSLDWGLETQVERELSETLEILVCQMTKVNLGHRQPICSIADVIHVCKERLYDPSQAAKHYRSVCSGLFSHTAELCQYLQIVQQSRKSLQKLFESETQLVARVTTDWVSSWRDLVDEMSRGVLLRPLAKRLTVSKCPQPAETPPFNQLLRDIQCRRYTLRKVQLTDVGDGQRKLDPHQTLLEFIRSRPKLRPVSERRIGLKPKEQISRHELLMEEIRSTDHCKRLAHNTESNCKHGLTITGEAEERSFLKSAPHRIRADEAVGSGSDAQDASFTDFTLCAGKRRTRSFASNRDLFKVVKSSNRGSVLTTIVDVMKMHSSEEKGDVKDLSCERYEDWRVRSLVPLILRMMKLFCDVYAVCSQGCVSRVLSRDASALQALRQPSSELLQANRDERWRAKPEKLLERALVLEFSLDSSGSGVEWLQLHVPSHSGHARLVQSGHLCALPEGSTAGVRLAAVQLSRHRLSGDLIGLSFYLLLYLSLCSCVFLVGLVVHSVAPCWF
ncbi:protein spire homolog 1 isoform X1 [Sinocyclocheilus grahami]|uniref:protein spire homolog 1 isoform X1 n=1 Tax=Sinocyclocheilus grahami TaxID=75366 RepID=UPI0007AC8863|nr:PREDICTED: protein spire homolog 1-like isoform X1 [Sinocyclocheilus grahami]